MFNRLLRKNNKELKQRVIELEKTCCDLENLVDMLKERNKLTTKKAKRKIEADNHDKATSI